MKLESERKRIVYMKAIRTASKMEVIDHAESVTLGSDERYYKRAANKGRLAATATLHIMLTDLTLTDRNDRMKFLNRVFGNKKTGRIINSTKDILVGEYVMLQRAKASGVLESAVKEYREVRKIEIAELNSKLMEKLGKNETTR
jgi:hypothetical protein